MDIRDLLASIQSAQKKKKEQCPPPPETVALLTKLESCKEGEVQDLIVNYLKDRKVAERFSAMSGLRKIIVGSTTYEALKSIDATSPVCGVRISGNDLMWKCHTCTKQGDSTCFCSDCFDRELHAGHRTSFKLHSNGNCDCGDVNASEPNTFCGRHRVVPNLEQMKRLLPSYISLKSPLILREAARWIHKIVAANEDKGSRLLYEFIDLLSAFGANPVCQRLAADVLMLSFPEHLTSHACTQEQHDPAPHPCSCSMTDFMIKYCTAVPGIVHLYKDSISQLTRSFTDYSLFMARAYWKNYYALLDNSIDKKNNAELSGVVYQAMFNYEQIMPTLMTCMDTLANTIKQFHNVLCIVPMPTHAFQFPEMLARDFIGNFNYNGCMSKHIFEHKKIVDALCCLLIELCKINVFTDPPSYKNNVEVYITEYYLYSLWTDMLSYSSFSKLPESTRAICLQTVTLQLEESETKLPPCPDFNSASVWMYRIFGSIALELLFGRSESAQKGLITPSDYLSVRQDLRTFAGYAEDKLDLVLRQTILRLLRCECFIIDCNPLFWGRSNAIVQLAQLYNNISSRLDCGILQLLLALLVLSPRTQTVDLFELLKEATGYDFFETRLRTDETPTIRSEYNGQRLFLICRLLFDTVSLFLGHLEIARISLKESRKTPPARYALYEHCTQSLGLVMVMTDDEAKAPFSQIALDNLISRLPNEIKTQETEEMLEKILEPARSTEERKTVYKITRRSLRNISVFNQSAASTLSSFETNLAGLLKLHALSDFDALLPSSAPAFSEELRTLLVERCLSRSSSALETLCRLLTSENEVLKGECIKPCVFYILRSVVEHATPACLDVLKAHYKELEAEGRALVRRANVYESGVRSLLERVQHRGSSSDLQVLTSSVPSSESMHQLYELRRKQVLEAFKKKQTEFASKHVETLAKIDASKKGESEVVCSVCLESLQSAKLRSSRYLFKVIIILDYISLGLSWIVQIVACFFLLCINLSEILRIGMMCSTIKWMIGATVTCVSGETMNQLSSTYMF